MSDSSVNVFWTRRGSRNVILALLATTAACLWIDIPMSRWFFREGNGGARLLRPLLDNTETFGHGVGVAWICLAIFTLDVSRRWAALSLATTALCAGTVANFIKLAVGRTRPRNFDWNLTSPGDTFNGWLPSLTGQSSGFSFPSAHVATAVAMAVWLSVAYSRGRKLFAGLAVLVACHRLYSGAHFASDICGGAVIGWIVGTQCVLLGLKYGYLTEAAPITAPVPVGQAPACLPAVDGHTGPMCE